MAFMLRFLHPTITSSVTYLADPLNAYALLELPKPSVHLVGPPSNLSLAARQGGGKGCFVRSGCPNVDSRPVLCDGASIKSSANANARDAERLTEGSKLSFGISVLRDLVAGEEVMLV